MDKELSEFYRKGAGLTARCSACIAAENMARYNDKYRHDQTFKSKRKTYAAGWYLLNSEKTRTRHASNHRNQRLLCFEKYGKCCACCGETEYEFLSFDHINGGGRQHRQKIGGKLCRWLVQKDFPTGYRVLCHNCNQSIGLYGYCPHEKIKSKSA